MGLISDAPLSAFGASGASGTLLGETCGCGTTFMAGNSACSNVAGDNSPGETITRAPILVQPHIFTAKDSGMRMQPCEAG